jgi:hypothetical protein
MISELANPFATLLEILLEWHFFPIFKIFCIVFNKLSSVILVLAIKIGLLKVPFLRNVNTFQNPFCHPIVTMVIF